jgi:hypothetical protein
MIRRQATKKINVLGGFLYLVCFLSVFLFAHKEVHAIGISPSSITVDGILADTILPKKVTISRANAQTREIGFVEVSGAQKDAIIAPKQIILPAGEQEVIFPFGIATAGLPVDEDLTATISFVFAPADPSPGSVSIALSLLMRVRFRVVKEHVDDYTIEQVSFSSKEDGHVNMYYILKNDGNVSTKPELIRMTFHDTETLEEAGVYEISSDNIPGSAPFQFDVVYFDVEHRLSSGVYTIFTEVIDDGEVVFSQRQDTIQVIGGASFVTALIREPSFQYSVTILVMGVGGLVWLRKDYRTLR